jgi:3-phosphoshikimate 1-carboxyvinyltransferase
MQVIIEPSIITGIVQAPASKSSMQRACAAALLCHGETIISNAGKSQDDQASLALIEAMGASSAWLDKRILKVTSSGIHPDTQEVNCGESGLGIRMFTPILALSNLRITINGRGSLLTRPIDFFEEVLPKLSVKVSTNQGKLPMTIEGPLVPASISMDGSLSSQFLTGMLMAFSAAKAKNKTIRVNNLKSRPYIDLTLAVMKEFGMHLPENRNYEEFFFPAPVLVSEEFETVPG